MKIFLVILIFTVLAMSGCTQGGNTSQTIPNQQMQTGSWEWVKFGTRNIEPLIVFNEELYGYENSFDYGYTYKLVDGDWKKIGTKHVIPHLIYNNSLYGIGYNDGYSGYNTYKLSGDKWIELGIVKPDRVYKNELYGYKYIGFGYKLVNNSWSFLSNIYVAPFYNDSGFLYGVDKNNFVYEFVNNEWDILLINGTYTISVGGGCAEDYRGHGEGCLGEKVVSIDPSQGDARKTYKLISVFNNTIYVQGGCNKCVGEYDGYNIYKLINGKMVLVNGSSYSGFSSLIAYNNELYGFNEGYDGGYSFKIQGNTLVKVGTNDILPKVVYNKELYGFRNYDGAYKLVKN